MAESFETVIGLEVHVELLTRTKLFCGCPNRFGAPPNTHVCPVCLGLPGTLPVMNARAVDLLLKAALSVGCAIPSRSKMDRKQYFYPDMPKNFQISQYDLPLAVDGHLETALGRVRILRIHLEEDTGKSTHPTAGTTGRIDSAEYTLEDYNRAGVPLAEIVSHPDMRSADEAVAYLVKLREIMRWVGVSDCKMEEGSLRCDANVSVRPTGSPVLGTKVEIKNLNSFKSVHRAIEHEARRQVEAVTRGERIVQETRAWDEAREVTHSLRSKEFAHDYRYFPEPDLPPLEVDEAWQGRLRAELPELPEARRERYKTQYGLNDADADTLTRTREMSDFYEQAVAALADEAAGKSVANWLMSDVSRLLNAEGIGIENSRLRPEHLATMIRLIESGVITSKIAKEVLEAVYATGQDPEAVVEAKGLRQIDDPDQLRPVLQQVLERNAKSVQDFLGGKDKVFEALVGQVMGATRGRAHPGVVRDLMRRMLDEMRSMGRVR